MPQPANKRFVMEDKLTTELALKAPIASPTFTGIATFGSISSVNSNSQVNAASSITAGTHITATLGNITAGAGNITATGGTVTGGAGVTATTGDVVATAGGVTAATRILSNSTTAITNTSTGHAVQAGPQAGLNVRLGTDGTNAGVQAVNNGAYSTLGINSLGGNISIGNASTTTTLVSPLVTATGSATLAPLRIPAGTLLTTPVDDVIETDTNGFYATTSTTHGRGVIATNLFTSGTATFTSTTGAQNLFPVPNDTITLADSTAYFVEGLIHISVPATSSVAHTMSFTLNGGTATTTAQVMAFATQNNTSATAIPTAAASYLLTSAGASTIWATASTAATAVFRTVYFSGILRCTTTGTFIPKITTSVASVAIPAGTTNNYIKLTPIGSSSVVSQGTWS